MIRTALLGDVDSMIDVATASRFAFTAWDGDLWRTDSTESAANQLLLRAQLGSPSDVTLVAERDGQLVGWVRAVNCPQDAAWTVADFAVGADGDWQTVGRALLVALAGKVKSTGAQGLTFPSPHSDRARAELLSSAGLVRVGAAGHRRAIRTADHPPDGVRAYVAADAEDVARLTAGRPLLATGLAVAGGRTDGLVVDDGAGVIGVAVVRKVARNSVTLAMTRGAVIVEPYEVAVGSSWPDVGERLLGGVEWLAARSGDAHLVVPTRLDADAKVAAIDVRGDGWPIDVWALEW